MTAADARLLLFALTIPSCFALAISFLYSRATLLGIAAARHKQYRLTPQSPWYFFDRVFRPYFRRTLIAILVVYFPIVIATWVLESPAVYHYETYGIAGMELDLLGFCLASSIGLSMIIASAINLWAPRFGRIVALAFVGLLHAASLVLISLCLTVIAYELDHINSDFPEIRGGYCLLFPIIGVPSYFLSWLYIRRRLDRAWFRFEE